MQYAEPYEILSTFELFEQKIRGAPRSIRHREFGITVSRTSSNIGVTQFIPVEGDG